MVSPLLASLAGARLENGGGRGLERDASAFLARPPSDVSLGKAFAAKVPATLRLRCARAAPRGGMFLAICFNAYRGVSMAENLEGVRLRRWNAPIGVKRLMSRSLASRNLVSYEIVEPPAEAPSVDGRPREKRSSARQRLRLRSAKLLDSQSAFICECLVRDQSAQGLCLKLMKNIGLPARCILYDDETGALDVVTTMWRRGSLLGVRYSPSSTPVAIKPTDRSALRGRYHAVRD
jgi:hypothetical protein